MNNFSRRAAAITVIGAVVFGGLSFAQAASADVVTTGTITLQGKAVNGVAGTGATVTSGDATANPMFAGITVSQGCPAGYRYSSNTLIWQGGVFKGAISTARTASTTAYGQTGLDGNPIAMDDSYAAPATSAFVANKALNSIATPLAAGDFEVRVYCFATQSANFVSDKWFSKALTLSADLATWSTPVAPAPKSDTTASLTAASDQSTKKITLTATVKSGATTAANFNGNCSFFNSDGTLLETVPVNSGVASSTTGVLAVGTYSYTAKFVGTSDVHYNDSAVSSSSSATINGDKSGASTENVVIPVLPGAISLSGVASSVNLGTAVVANGMLTASGQLGSITVTDTHQSDSLVAWSLTGQTTDFTAGTKSFSGKYLGWTPALVGSTNAGAAGVAVVGGTAASAVTSGLKTASVLASVSTAAAASGTATTTTGATLNLAVPSNTPAGSYTAVLTLTLT